MTLDRWGWSHVAVFGLFVPWLAYCSSRRLNAGAPWPNRTAVYGQTMLMLGIFLAFSLVVANVEGIWLLPQGQVSAAGLIAGSSALAVGLGTVPWRWRLASAWRRRRLLALVPCHGAEWFWWFALSLAAGIAEEVTYRGVMVTLLERATGDWWLSVGLCVIAFALAHLVQGWISVATVAIFALGFHLIVRFTGTLYVAIAVHVIYDLLAGFYYGTRTTDSVDDSTLAHPSASTTPENRVDPDARDYRGSTL